MKWIWNKAYCILKSEHYWNFQAWKRKSNKQRNWGASLTEPLLHQIRFLSNFRSPKFFDSVIKKVWGNDAPDSSSVVVVAMVSFTPRLLSFAHHLTLPLADITHTQSESCNYVLLRITRLAKMRREIFFERSLNLSDFEKHNIPIYDICEQLTLLK